MALVALLRKIPADERMAIHVGYQQLPLHVKV
jgi:hypothetical protein